MVLYKAFEKAFEECGKDIVRSNVLVNVLSDYHAFENKATRRILSTFIQLGLGDSISDLIQSDAPDKLLKVKAFLNELVNVQGFQESQVSYVLDSLVYALGWTETPPKSLETSSHGSIHNFSKNNKVFQINGCQFTMVYVKGGTYAIGATPEQGLFAGYDEKPSREVILDDFFIGETLVTQKLWSSVMKSNPSHFKGENLPVEMVSWDDCNSFLNLLSASLQVRFSLPTEAEWEYAARGGNKTKNRKYAGCDDSAISDYVWFKETSGGCTHDVMTKLPNELGLYDMSGNVSEWCLDWYFSSYANNSSKNNPTGPQTGMWKVFRGGSWYERSMDCRVSKRAYMNPMYRNKRVGLRLVISNR